MFRIVIVEDDIATLDNLKEFLQIQGYEVFAFSKSLRAVEQITELHPDLVFCDVRMEERNSGLVITEKLKTNPETQSIPIILLTAYADKDTQEQGREVGADAYICKPYSLSDILDAVAQFLS